MMMRADGQILTMVWESVEYKFLLTSITLFTARKRLVAPNPRGGEEEAQEEASCPES